jgi:photosystem II stability/assembly factor-like uncharacterized protein
MLKYLIFLIFFLFNLNAYSQWVFQHFAGQYIGFYAMQFVNSNTGYVVGSLEASSTKPKICKTTNSGIVWDTIPLHGQIYGVIYDLSFLDSDVGYVCGTSLNVYKTTNGGINWSPYLLPYYNVSQDWNAVHFVDYNTGYIGGKYGMTAKTTNGGNNWFLLDTAMAHINNMYFLNSTTGYLVDSYSGIYKTTDGGNSWLYKFVQDSLGTGYALMDIRFYDNNTGYIAGSTVFFGAIMKTTDSGNSWKVILRTENPFFNVACPAVSKVYVSSYTYNRVYYSTNAGLSWSVQYVGGDGSLLSLSFTNEFSGYCTNNSSIYKTTNGGVWITQISSAIPEDYILYQNYPNPFNPSTTITFEIPSWEGYGDSRGVGLITLKIYDINGREVAVLVNEKLQPGSYQADWNASSFSSGVYFCKLAADNFSKTKRMILLK